MIALCFLANSCGNNENKNAKNEVVSSNPLLQKSDLPFQAIPFDKINDSDFQPAMEEGMQQKIVEIQKIVDNPDSPTFHNTLVAMKKAGNCLPEPKGKCFDFYHGYSGNQSCKGFKMFVIYSFTVFLFPGNCKCRRLVS